MKKSGSKSVAIEEVEVGVPLKFLAEVDGLLNRTAEKMQLWTRGELASYVPKDLRRDYARLVRNNGNGENAKSRKAEPENVEPEKEPEEESDAFYDRTAKGFVCGITKKHQDVAYDTLEIVEHLERVHRIKPDDQVIDGWTSRHQLEYEKEAARVAKKRVKKLRKEKASRRMSVKGNPPFSSLGRDSISRVPLTELQRLGLPQLAKRRFRVGRCPASCPRLAQQSKCTPDNCLEMGKKIHFEEAYVLAKNNRS